MDSEPTAGHGTESCNPIEPGRRRGPYTLRACDACRRRKGKCDGRLPCRHCAARKVSCVFSPLPRVDPREEASTVDSTQPQLSTRHLSDTADVAAVGLSESQPDFNTPPDSCTSSADTAALTRMVVQLQRQVDQLVTEVEMSRPRQHLGNVISDGGSGGGGGGDGRGGRGGRGTGVPTFTDPTSSGVLPVSPSNSRFCGPTSPDFSMNLAQTKGRQGTFSASPARHGFPGTTDETTSIAEGDVGDSGNLSVTFESQAAPPSMKHSKLLLYRSIMSLPETMRLLQLYRDIMGDLHPVVDIDSVMCHAIALSSGQNNTDIGENSLMILNLCLMISLRAETNAPVTEMESRLSASLTDLLNSKLVAPAGSLEDVIVVVLMGVYYFYQDVIHTAWRMCGVAGHLMMELGFHKSDFLRTQAASDGEREQAAVLQATIFVFDRQWSAAIGLPTNFQDLNFDSIPQDMLKSPYLSAMISFLSTSDRFADFISSSAKGDSHEDVDAYEVLNLQLEQWRRRFVGAQSISLIWQKIQSQNPATRLPSWALLLAMRAEAVRTLLLRPLFFPKTNEKASEKNIKPALELIFNLVGIISALDKTTNLYCVQGPFYHHVLHSAAALFYLIVTYAEGKSFTIRATMSTHAETIASIYQTMLDLSTKYFIASRASRRLFGRLTDLRATLDRLGVAPSPVASGATATRWDEPPINSSSTTEESAQPNAVDDGQANADTLSRFSEEQRLLWQRRVNTGPMALDMEPLMDMGCAETILFNWPMEDQELMFSLNELDEH